MLSVHYNRILKPKAKAFNLLLLLLEIGISSNSSGGEVFTDY